MSKTYVLNFWKELSEILPNCEDSSLEIKFHLVLVKFGAKPSTELINLKEEEKLLLNTEFLKFIENDNDLEAGLFATENEIGRLWIFNKKFKHLFKDVDLFGKDLKLVYKTRFSRLGYACSDYFLTSHGNLSLQVETILEGRPFIGYFCPLNNSRSESYEAVDLWLTYKKYADILRLKFELRLCDGIA